jgi:hypothetical protein
MKWPNILLVIVLATLPGQAAEEAESKKPPPAKAEKADKSRDVFIPSEEISEDIAIAFPVDI